MLECWNVGMFRFETTSSSAPLLLCPLCVKIILSQSRDSFPNLVNPVNPVKGTKTVSLLTYLA